MCLARVPELWNDGLHARKNKKKDPFCAVKKKKPVVVSDILSPERSAALLAVVRHLRHPPAQRVFYLDASVTALYRLHAAGPGHPRRLDRHQEGKQEDAVRSRAASQLR